MLRKANDRPRHRQLHPICSSPSPTAPMHTCGPLLLEAPEVGAPAAAPLLLAPPAACGAPSLPTSLSRRVRLRCGCCGESCEGVQGVAQKCVGAVTQRDSTNKLLATLHGR
jgi:hypothetical protein